MAYHTFLYFCLLCALFFNTDAASYLGVTSLTTAAFTPLLIAVVIKYARKQINFSYRRSKPAIIIFIISIIIIIVKLLIDQDVVKKIINFTIIPICIISVVFDRISYKEKKAFQNSLLTFFVFECILAILERILQKRFFDTIYTAERYDYITFQEHGWQFRSTSLLGHPLENAMVVSIILVFILFSNLTYRSKLLLYVMGYASLFCFNARGAIVVASVLLLPFLIKITFKKYKKWKMATAFLLILTISMAIYLIISFNLGGRLVNSDSLVDASGMERVNVFTYLDFISSDKLLLGDTESYKFLLLKLDLVGIENGVITAILTYGYILGIPLLLSLFHFQWTKLNDFSPLNKSIILLTFWSLGFVNPNLVDPTQWYIFVFSFIAFSPYIATKQKKISVYEQSLLHNTHNPL